MNKATFGQIEEAVAVLEQTVDEGADWEDVTFAHAALVGLLSRYAREQSV